MLMGWVGWTWEVRRGCGRIHRRMNYRARSPFCNSGRGLAGQPRNFRRNDCPPGFRAGTSDIPRLPLRLNSGAEQSITNQRRKGDCGLPRRKEGWRRKETRGIRGQTGHAPNAEKQAQGQKAQAPGNDLWRRRAEQPDRSGQPFDAQEQVQRISPVYNPPGGGGCRGSQLIPGIRITQCAGGRNEGAATVEAIPEDAGAHNPVLAGSGRACGFQPARKWPATAGSGLPARQNEGRRP